MKRLVLMAVIAVAACGSEDASEGVSLTAEPNPITVCDDVHGRTRVAWFREHFRPIEIRINSVDGPLFSAGPPHGAAWTGSWVADGTIFLLVDARTREVLATIAVAVETDCSK